MRILLIVPYAPSLIRVRPFQVARALARRGHHLTLATLASSADDLDGLKQLSAEGVEVRVCRLSSWRPLWNCLKAAPTRVPLQAAYSWHPGLAKEIKNILDQSVFDVVHVEHLRGAFYGLRVRELLRGTARPSRSSDHRLTAIVWDSVDCISHLFRQARNQSRSLKGRLMTRLELSRTESCEGWIAGQFDRVLVTSQADQEALAGLADRWAVRSSDQRFKGRGEFESPSIRVVPNGVDLEYFQPGEDGREAATLVYSGKMSYHANVTAARYLVDDIMPFVWSRRPDVRVVIVGKDPPREIRSLARNGGRVEVTDSVPDIRPYMRRATIAAVPLVYGAGVQNKVLEAMACATPVVASERAVSAISARPGQDIIVARSAGEFARELLALLEDPPRREAIGAAGRAYVEANHCWKDIAAMLDKNYEEARQAAASCPLAAVSGPRRWY